jgi:glycosyltransferase involved in cell wall biosynthesis
VSEPLVSIATASYNHERYLVETIESVLGQDYPHVEYLVVDDGSTDGSRQILRRYAERLAWSSVQENAGQAVALNRALEHATGGVLSFLSSDDTLLPGTVSRVVRAFADDPEVLVVYGDVWLTDERSERMEYGVSGEWDAARMGRSAYAVHQPAMFFTRRAWEIAGPFNERSWGLFDVEFVLRLVAVGPARYLREPLATFRLHPESKQMSRHVAMAEEHVRFAHEFYESPELPDALRPYASAGRAALYRRAALRYYAAGEIAAARRLFLRSLLLSPRGLSRKQAARLVRTLVPASVVRRRREAGRA